MATKTLNAAALAATVALGACSAAAPPAPAPAAYVPPPVTTIPLERTPNGGLVLTAAINGVPMKLILDSGADDVVLPASVAGPLFDLGLLTKEEFAGKGVSRLANGSQSETLRFNLRSVTIGDITLHDVPAVVIDSEAPPLLGQSILSALPAYRIDNTTNTLTVN